MPLYSLDGATPETPGEGHFWVAPDAHVIGKVVLGENVGIWFGAVLRGDNEPITVGDGTNIQEGAMLHADMGFPCTIGANVTVGHHAIVHGCTVGDGSLIGMGSTVMNGAVIGANSIVGANALVPEGKVFPEYSLIIGSPAKAVRTLDAETMAKVAESSAGYVRNWKRFAAGLKRID
ncbi:MAG: gamma carbonic anhydrase family protein [Pseudomonadota bacterium]